MKIAFYHELHKGGARRAVWELGRHLSGRHQVDLFISADKATPDEKKSFRKVFAYSFIEKKWLRGDWKAKLYKDTIEYFKLLQHNKKIADKINKENYDIVFVHPSQFTQAPFVLLFVKKLKVYYCQEPPRAIYDPAMNILIGVPFSKMVYEKAIRIIRRIVDRVNISRVDHVFVNSKFSKSSVKKAYGLKSTVAYLGVDQKFFSPSSSLRNIEVLYIGTRENIDNYKLFHSVKQKLPMKVRVYEHITSEEWLSDTELRNLYRRSKIVLVLQKNEPFGLIPIEASSCGCAVIALNSGGYKESVINGKTGYLIGESESELLNTISRLLSRKSLLEKMGKTARENIVANWSWDKSASFLEREIIKIYDKKK